MTCRNYYTLCWIYTIPFRSRPFERYFLSFSPGQSKNRGENNKDHLSRVDEEIVDVMITTIKNHDWRTSCMRTVFRNKCRTRECKALWAHSRLSEQYFCVDGGSEWKGELLSGHDVARSNFLIRSNNRRHVGFRKKKFAGEQFQIVRLISCRFPEWLMYRSPSISYYYEWHKCTLPHRHRSHWLRSRQRKKRKNSRLTL